jgi:hypothetical protein
MTKQDLLKKEPYSWVLPLIENGAALRSPHPNWPLIEEPVVDAYDRIIAGQQPVKQVLDEANKKIAEVLAQS